LAVKVIFSSMNLFLIYQVTISSRMFYMENCGAFD
jgi:hypothetical protein